MQVDFETFRFVAELVIVLLVTPFGAVLWWMLRKLVADVAALEKSTERRDAEGEKALADFRLHAAETYSTKNELGKAIEQFSRSIDAVFAKLERIEDKLDGKADK